MWWAIGIGVTLVAIVFIARSRTSADQLDLTTAARNHLAASYRAMNILDRNIDERVWTDHYLLGFGQGSLAIMIQCLAANLTSEEKGYVILNAFRALDSDRYSEVCDRMSDFFARQDAEFMRGMMHGSNVVILMLGRPGSELLADLDVQSALRAAPAMGRMITGIDGRAPAGPFAAAGAVLMHDYLDRHRTAAGYQKR